MSISRVALVGAALAVVSVAGVLSQPAAKPAFKGGLNGYCDEMKAQLAK